jgi:hypothetical protein
MVKAIDIEARPGDPKDPMVGRYTNGYWLVEQIKARNDPRVRYIIFDRYIWHNYPFHDTAGVEQPPWTKMAFVGPGLPKGRDPHLLHVHIETNPGRTSNYDTSPWGIGPPRDN